jgi:putative oxidoreductase
MQPILGAWSEPIYALLRIVVGFLFWCHGAQKFGLIPGPMGPMHVHGLMLMAGIVEFTCGILIATGLFTSPAALVACGEMAVAYFMQHFPRGFWPIRNMGEPAVFYCFTFLYFAARGAGGFSLDALLRRRGAAAVTARA